MPSKSICAIFLIAFTHFLYLCHILVSLTIFQSLSFTIIVFVTRDQVHKFVNRWGPLAQPNQGQTGQGEGPIGMEGLTGGGPDVGRGCGQWALKWGGGTNREPAAGGEGLWEIGWLARPRLGGKPIMGRAILREGLQAVAASPAPDQSGRANQGWSWLGGRAVGQLGWWGLIGSRASCGGGLQADGMGGQLGQGQPGGRATGGWPAIPVPDQDGRPIWDGGR